MAGDIGGEGRREVGADEVAGRRTQGRPVRIADRVRVGVALAGRAAAGAGLADAGHRPPEAIKIFAVPAGDRGVGHRRVDQRQHVRQIERIAGARQRQLDRDLVVLARPGADPGAAVVAPEDADPGLVGRAHGWRADAVAAEALDLVERGRVLGAVQRRRRRGAKLRGRLQHEGPHASPAGAQRNRIPADRIRTPFGQAG